MSGSDRPCHLSGSGRSDLASRSQPLDLDRELAGARRHHRAVDADPVAAVERLDVGEGVVADDGLGDEQLDLDAAVGDRGEHELARVALEEHAAGDADLDVGLGCPARGRPPLAHLGRRVGAVEAVRVRLAAGGADGRRPVLAARPLGRQPAARQLGECRSSCGGVGLRHRRPTVPARACVGRGLRCARRRVPVLGALRSTAMATHLLIIGGGPAGNTAATYAARSAPRSRWSSATSSAAPPTCGTASRRRR